MVLLSVFPLAFFVLFVSNLYPFHCIRTFAVSFINKICSIQHDRGDGRSVDVLVLSMILGVLSLYLYFPLYVFACNCICVASTGEMWQHGASK